MKRHFSSRELFALRNHIPIDTLIEKHLMLPSKVSEGYFDFFVLCVTNFKPPPKPKPIWQDVFAVNAILTPSTWSSSVKGCDLLKASNI